MENSDSPEIVGKIKEIENEMEEIAIVLGEIRDEKDRGFYVDPSEMFEGGGEEEEDEY